MDGRTDGWIDVHVGLRMYGRTDGGTATQSVVNPSTQSFIYLYASKHERTHARAHAHMQTGKHTRTYGQTRNQPFTPYYPVSLIQAGSLAGRDTAETDIREIV